MDPDRNRHGTHSAALVLAIAALLVAVGLLWIDFCQFTGSSWNDVRLVPSFMAAAGEPVYTLPGQGVVTTWMYGPVPLWVWMPAVLANNPVTAISIAGWINLLTTVAALSATCLFWPALRAGKAPRLVALALTFVIWPEHGFRFLQADNVAVMLALAANLLLVVEGPRAGRISRWIIAIATAGFLGCKPTTVGILLAQLLWLLLDRGRAAALRHLVRTAIAGFVLGAAAVTEFGFKALWFGAITIPMSLPHASDPLGRIGDLLPILTIQWVVPAIAALLIGRPLLRPGHPLRLPFLAWLLCLPLDFAGLMTAGGSTNNLHGFQMLIAPLLVALMSEDRAIEPFRRQMLAVSAVVILLFARIGAMDRAPLLPSTNNLKAAIEIGHSLAGRVWMPWNPLVSYFEDGKFYHCEDGLYVRQLTGYPVSRQQVIDHLPPHFSAIAYRVPRLDWQIADAFEGKESRRYRIDDWEIVVWPVPDAP